MPMDPNPQTETYFCQKCGIKYQFSNVSNLVCKSCGWRVFRKAQTESIIRIYAV
jgi:DNA-directed RNA polymerase subunit RPC12/RpoP